MAKKETLWITTDGGANPDKFSMLPEWMRSVAVQDGDKLFIPSAYVGNPEIVFLLVSADNVRILIDENNNFYVPAEWAKKEFKHKKSIVELIESVEANVERFMQRTLH